MKSIVNNDPEKHISSDSDAVSQSDDSTYQQLGKNPWKGLSRY